MRIRRVLKTALGDDVVLTVAGVVRVRDHASAESVAASGASDRLESASVCADAEDAENAGAGEHP